MGGYGALVLAFDYPDVFGAAGAHSPSLHRLANAPDFLGDADSFARRDPLALAAVADPATAPRVWLDVGDGDGYAPEVADLHQVLDQQGIDNEYHVWSGDHEDPYWIQHVPDYLQFYDSVLRDDGE